MNDIPKLWKWRQLRGKKIFGQVHLRKLHNPLKFNSKFVPAEVTWRLWVWSQFKEQLQKYVSCLV